MARGGRGATAPDLNAPGSKRVWTAFILHPLFRWPNRGCSLVLVRRMIDLASARSFGDVSTVRLVRPALATAPRTTPTASDMATASRNALSVLFLELNEAERYWIDKLVRRGEAPGLSSAARGRRVPEDIDPRLRPGRGSRLAHDHALDHLAVGLHRHEAARARHRRFRPGHDADPGAMRLGRARQGGRLDRRVRQLAVVPAAQCRRRALLRSGVAGRRPRLLPRRGTSGAGVLGLHVAQLQRELRAPVRTRPRACCWDRCEAACGRPP